MFQPDICAKVLELCSGEKWGFKALFGFLSSSFSFVMVVGEEYSMWCTYLHFCSDGVRIVWTWDYSGPQIFKGQTLLIFFEFLISQNPNPILRGCIHLLNTCKYCDKTRKYCGNTHGYWANTWKMWSPASAIFASIVTILVSFEAILKRFTVKINFKSQFQSKL